MKNNEYKIRMIRTPRYEKECIYIAIDTLPPYDMSFNLTNKTHSYEYAYKIYEYKGDNNENFYLRGNLLPLSVETDIRMIGAKDSTIRRDPTDVFELPSPTEYMRLSIALRAEGYIFNKKLGKLIKKGKIN